MQMSTVPVTDIDSLRSATSAGWRPSYLFFWGHRARNAAPGKHILSQWWPARFELDGATFPTVEHYMMAEKARLFGDEGARAQIMTTTDPAQAKTLGRKVRNFDDRVWTQQRFDIVVRGNIAKFGQNTELGEWLRNTAEDIVVEASPYDAIWGIGLRGEDVRANDPQQWRGLNLLGFALMKVRAGLR